MDGTDRDVLLQPFVHRLRTSLRLPTLVLADDDGDVCAAGAQGAYLGDRRMLSRFELRVQSRRPEVVDVVEHTNGDLHITAIVRDGSEPNPDPVLLLVRTRRLRTTGFDEHWELTNRGVQARDVVCDLRCGSDFMDMTSVKVGHPPGPVVQPNAHRSGLRSTHGGATTVVSCAPAPDRIDPFEGSLSIDCTLAPQQTVAIDVAVTFSHDDDGAFRPSGVEKSNLGEAPAPTGDQHLDRWLDRSFADLGNMLLADPLAPDDRFAAAGAPWYTTLFGRDSLWTARMMLPFSVELAQGTLRALARRQGTRRDVESDEQPGRILHEIRAERLVTPEISLPVIYYGTIDATPLWITLLGEAYEQGLPDAPLRELAPALRAAAGWLTTAADGDGDGLVEYVTDAPRGLANHGWKDSGDSVSWRSGELAKGPIALCEVQGYAYEAAVYAARMLDVLGVDGAAELDVFASRLRDRFHEQFWLEDANGAYVATALDADKRAVDTVTSNQGHLLGTGLLDRSEEEVIVERLMRELDCGAGLRTLAAGSGRYNEVSYHNGSVWPHDTAIVIRGMLKAGFSDAARTLAVGLVRAAAHFDGRLPELFSVIDGAHIVPYPASCRPQAWTAASAVVVAQALHPRTT
jgi:glycogen debranching enzyme